MHNIHNIQHICATYHLHLFYIRFIYNPQTIHTTYTKDTVHIQATNKPTNNTENTQAILTQSTNYIYVVHIQSTSNYIASTQTM